jgi:plasmid stabilization system protein ParE
VAGHKPPIVWSPEALGDIDLLWDYHARAAGRATADKMMRDIARVVAAIDDFGGQKQTCRLCCVDRLNRQPRRDMYRYSITASARGKNVSGIVRSTAFARGARPAGLRPRRILVRGAYAQQGLAVSVVSEPSGQMFD